VILFERGASALDERDAAGDLSGIEAGGRETIVKSPRRAAHM
jgi:hypothetical protein